MVAEPAKAKTRMLATHPAIRPLFPTPEAMRSIISWQMNETVTIAIIGSLKINCGCLEILFIVKASSAKAAMLKIASTADVVDSPNSRRPIVSMQTNAIPAIATVVVFALRMATSSLRIRDKNSLTRRICVRS